MKEDLIRAVSTNEAPKAIGPYSQAIRCGNFLFLSGQVPLDPSTGVMVGNAIEEQTEQVLKNIAGVLKAEGLGMQNVVKTTVFLKNMGDFAKFNPIYERHVRSPYPARATIEVARLPKDALVEIEAIALCPE